jgi:hypothetical protein
VQFINANPRCTRKKLIETLAPTPKSAKAPAAPAAEVRSDSTPTPTEPAAVPVADPTSEQTAVLVDLHWLIHSGAVLEFADGRMDTAKKPLPRPVKQEKKKAEAKPASEGGTAVAAETALPAEGAEETVPEISGPTEKVVETPAPAEETAPAFEPPVSSETISSAVEPAPAVETDKPPA